MKKILQALVFGLLISNVTHYVNGAAEMPKKNIFDLIKNLYIEREEGNLEKFDANYNSLKNLIQSNPNSLTQVNQNTETPLMGIALTIIELDSKTPFFKAYENLFSLILKQPNVQKFINAKDDFHQSLLSHLAELYSDSLQTPHTAYSHEILEHVMSSLVSAGATMSDCSEDDKNILSQILAKKSSKPKELDDEKASAAPQKGASIKTESIQ